MQCSWQCSKDAAAALPVSIVPGSQVPRNTPAEEAPAATRRGAGGPCHLSEAGEAGQPWDSESTESTRGTGSEAGAKFNSEAAASLRLERHSAPGFSDDRHGPAARSRERNRGRAGAAAADGTREPGAARGGEVARGQLPQPVTHY